MPTPAHTRSPPGTASRYAGLTAASGLYAWRRTCETKSRQARPRPVGGAGRGRGGWLGQESSLAMNRACQLWYQTWPVVALTDSIPLMVPCAVVVSMV